MDSPRGGPLTTFIMMLPLIVVPTIAMLKPADLQNGLVSSLLSAASGKASPTDRDDTPADERTTAEDEFAAEFEEVSNFDSEFSELNAPLFDESPRAPVPKRSANSSRTPKADIQSNPFDTSSDDGDIDTEILVKQLQQLGALRIMWFSTGSEPSVGCAAFFAIGNGLDRYRFEAVATTKKLAAQDVLQQAAEWKAMQR